MESHQVSSEKVEKQPVLRLASLWQLCVELETDQQPKQLAPREMGQLKLLRKRFGVWTPDVIRWVTDNWSSFSQCAACTADLGCAPSKPHIGFLLAHCDVVPMSMALVAEKQPDTPFAQKVEQIQKYIEQ